MGLSTHSEPKSFEDLDNATEDSNEESTEESTEQTDVKSKNDE
ncbi:MAG: hypothetical protein ACOC22_03230 [bacterium]